MTPSEPIGRLSGALTGLRTVVRRHRAAGQPRVYLYTRPGEGTVLTAESPHFQVIFDSAVALIEAVETGNKPPQVA